MVARNVDDALGDLEPAPEFTDDNPDWGRDDPSHPPFYLPGQSESGNVRAFVALKPCQQDGTSCETGLDCCSGFCEIAQDGQSGSCVAEPDRCSQIKEKCTSDADCCPPEDYPSCAMPFTPIGVCWGCSRLMLRLTISSLPGMGCDDRIIVSSFSTSSWR